MIEDYKYHQKIAAPAARCTPQDPLANPAYLRQDERQAYEYCMIHLGMWQNSLADTFDRVSDNRQSVHRAWNTVKRTDNPAPVSKEEFERLVAFLDFKKKLINEMRLIAISEKF